MPVSRRLKPEQSSVGGVITAAPARILRPLLAVSRSEIGSYAARKRLRWVEDESNAQERFARNYLRMRIMPSLERRFPGCHASLARSSFHLAEASHLLDELAKIDARSVMTGERVSVARLKAIGQARAANFLRFFLASRGLAGPATRHSDEILRQLCTERRDADPLLRVGSVCLRRFKGWVELAVLPEVDRGSVDVPWAGEGQLDLPSGGQLRVRATRGRGVSAAKLEGGAVTVRRRRGGERIRLRSSQPRRTLKNLLQEAKIPPWQRERMPLVYLNDELVCVPGIGIDWKFQSHGRERALVFSWTDPRSTPPRR